MRKRTLVIGLVSGLAVLALTTGAAFAQSATPTPGANGTHGNGFAARVAAILGVDQVKVESAMKQAAKEQQAEALKARMDKLVAAGKITQQQADDYLKWLAARPDGIPFGGMGLGGLLGKGKHGGWEAREAHENKAHTPKGHDDKETTSSSGTSA